MQSHCSVFQVTCPEEIKKWELSLFVQVTSAVFISCSGSVYKQGQLPFLDKQPEIHCINKHIKLASK